MRTERNVVYYEVWRDQVNMRRVIEWCFEHKNTDIIIDCAKENNVFGDNPSWVKDSTEQELNYVDSVKSAIKWNSDHSNRLMLVVGNYKPNSLELIVDDLPWEAVEYPDRFSPKVSLYESSVQLGLWDDIQIWPNYFLTWNGYKVFKHAAHRLPVKYDMNKLFILKIRQAKNHRILLLDELAKRDLLNKNMYTCVDPFGRLEKIKELINATHYNGGVRPGNANMVDDLYDQQPPGWTDTFMDVVSETHIGSHFYTEKTVWPLAYMKPFLIHGAQYQNLDLKKLGFQLFEEVFDYSFDSIESPRKRTEALAEELLRLQNADLDYNTLYKQLTPKLEHNLRRLIELFDHDEYMPKMVTQYGPRLWRDQWDKHEGDKGALILNPEMGGWLPMIDCNGRNATAMSLIRSRPYLAQLYYNNQ